MDERQTIEKKKQKKTTKITYGKQNKQLVINQPAGIH